MRLSTAMVLAMLGKLGMKSAIDNGIISIYSGTIPATPDAIPNGTKLVDITLASGARTQEVNSTGTVTVTGGSGSITAVTVGGIDILGGTVPFNASTTQSAADTATQINRNPKNRSYSATAVGNVITLTAFSGQGTLPNTLAVSSTGTLTCTYANMAGGVNAANGLQWSAPAALALTKPATDTWSGIGANTGTAGWFRICAPNDAGTAADPTMCRIDGTISTSGADMNLPSLSVVASSPFSIPSGAINLAQQ